MAAGILIPDKLDDETNKFQTVVLFVASFIAFFIAEIGDKTSDCDFYSRAQYADALAWVILGTTIGMLLANVPVMIIGKRRYR
ncbi:TMEM165/GDT1 family protein [Vibrio chagasii]|nr:TMEM165/GDT1 family protein [Vibrio chagasii]